MRCALMQTSLTPPDIGALQEVFRATGLFHELDAFSFARDAFGILVRQVEVNDARTLQQALTSRGIGVEVVPETSLPVLPPAKRIVRAACRAEGFAPFDLLGRELLIPWAQVAAVCAGRVKQVEFGKRITASVTIGQAPSPLSRGSSGFPSHSDHGGMGSLEYSPWSADRLVLTGEERNWRWTADLVLAGGLRFTFQAHEFHFQALGDRVTRSPDTNFALFLRDVLGWATTALTNRGAFALREGREDGPEYPTRNAFQEETLWLLWRLQQAGRYAPPAIT